MSVPLLVTTSVHATPELIEEARAQARALGARYWTRRGVTVAQVFRETGADRLLIVSDERWQLKDRETGTTYFFHPNMALVRGLNLGRGQRDLFAEATRLGPGDRHLDCTLGFAAEATLAAHLVGPEGVVVGLESVPELAAVTRQGVARFELQTRFLTDAMRRIRVVTADYRNYLPTCAAGDFDVVYFDPFFPSRLPGSQPSVGPLAFFGNHAPLEPPAVAEAVRVARRRVVIKHPWGYDLGPGIADRVTSRIETGKGRIAYSVIETAPEAGARESA